MTKIEERLEQDYQVAVRQKDANLIGVLRLIKSAIKNEQIAQKRSELADEDVVKILRRELKKRQESIEMFKQGNRLDLADHEEQEVGLIKPYLPVELSDEEITRLVKQIIEENNFSSAQDFGKLMKLAMAKAAGQADGTRISPVVKELLNKS
jgi:uncharacterized protein